jgi:hypothetical protein
VPERLRGLTPTIEVVTQLEPQRLTMVIGKETKTIASGRRAVRAHRRWERAEARRAARRNAQAAS